MGEKCYFLASLVDFIVWQYHYLIIIQFKNIKHIIIRNTNVIYILFIYFYVFVINIFYVELQE